MHPLGAGRAAIDGTTSRTAASATALLVTGLLATAVLSVIVLPAPPASAQDGGISVEEYLRVFPPAPVDVRAAVEGEAVVVTWSPPAAAADRSGLAYDPAIVGYRIYRVDDAGGRTLIGEVEAKTTRFRHLATGAGALQFAVTAVQRSGQESGLSHTAEARLP